MNEQEIQKLRASGFSDDEIRDYIADKQRQTQQSRQPGTQSNVDLRSDQGAELDPNAPSEALTNARTQGVPTEAQPSSFLSDVATVAPVFLAENAGKLALGTGGLGLAYAANQARKGMQTSSAARQAQAAAQMAQAQAATEQARAAQASAQGLQDRALARQAAQAAKAAPVAPQILDASGRPMAPSVRAPVAPVAPTMAAPVAPTMAAPTAPMPTAQPGLLDKTTAMIRQLAANKAVQGAARLGGLAGTASAAMYSPELGPAVPRTGRMRGMEINPITGRPWTPEQIQQYEANPSIYDAQLGAPQFQR